VINCSNNSKSIAVILVQLLKIAQLSILTSPGMFNILFRLSRTFAVQRFRLRFLLCAITMTAVATAADCSAFEDIFSPTDERASQQRVNRKRHDATGERLVRFEACITACDVTSRKETPSKCTLTVICRAAMQNSGA
jgi:hypothetical protein